LTLYRRVAYIELFQKIFLIKRYIPSRKQTIKQTIIGTNLKKIRTNLAITD